MRFQPSSNPIVANRDIRLRDGTWVPITKAPLKILVWRIFHNTAGKQNNQDQVDAAKEIYRRHVEGVEEIGRKTLARVTMHISPTCSLCGRKGIYVVGLRTYCSKHRDQAIVHLANTRNAMMKRRIDAKTADIYEHEKQKKTSDRLRRLGRDRELGSRGHQ